MISPETDFNQETLEQIAREMALAARTAPKAKGLDQLEILIVTGSDKDALADRMMEIAERQDVPSFLRDSKNIRVCGVVLLLGTKTRQIGLKYCGLCGYANCAAMAAGPGGVCVFAANDLGIATGSAVALAADHRIDTRIMYTAGVAALEQGLFSPDVKIAWGIPLSASGKSPFFDRG